MTNSARVALLAAELVHLANSADLLNLYVYLKELDFCSKRGAPSHDVRPAEICSLGLCARQGASAVGRSFPIA